MQLPLCLIVAVGSSTEMKEIGPIVLALLQCHFAHTGGVLLSVLAFIIDCVYLHKDMLSGQIVVPNLIHDVDLSQSV